LHLCASFRTEIGRLIARRLPLLPADTFVISPDDPSLKAHQFRCPHVRHRIWSTTELSQTITAVFTIYRRLIRPDTDRHIDHDVIRFDSILDQSFQPGKKSALVPSVVPGGVNPRPLHLVVVVPDRRDRSGRLIVENSRIDALIERDLEITGPN